MVVKQRIVIFDLDETLTQKGTWGRFVVRAIRNKPLKWLPFFLDTVFSQVKYMLRLGPREHVKESMMRWTLSGRSCEELEAMAETFAELEVGVGLRPLARSIIEQHRAAGDRIIIASAAVDLIVDPIARRLNIDEVVCTQMAYCAEGRLRKKLGSMNCYGCGKLNMIKAYLAQDPDYCRDSVHITMYSDSRSDLDIMCWADVGIAVHPSPRLAKCTEEYGFEVQMWD
ncbi:MAG: HAD-IB family hydrolase [Robiginitomaculum sp.]|nr:MAG: HAD-IB family hydrolase [Robiginitomaculum sp.]